MPSHKNTEVTKRKSIGPDCSPSCKLIIWGKGREFSQAMPPSLPAKGEGEGAAALHGLGTATLMQSMLEGGWHGSPPHERDKGQGNNHAMNFTGYFS